MEFLRRIARYLIERRAVRSLLRELLDIECCNEFVRRIVRFLIE